MVSVADAEALRRRWQILLRASVMVTAAVLVLTVVVTVGQRHDLGAIAWVVAGLVLGNGLALGAVSLLSNLRDGEMGVRGPG